MHTVLIAGPTASGKSALALTVARAIGGVVVNADSQQVYDTWQVLTARPTETEMEGIEHRLYGHVPLTRTYSAGAWLRDVLALPLGPKVIVGGTGLYFKALTEGLAPIPPVPSDVRASAEAELASVGPEAFAASLARDDPATAARIDMVNPRRVLRAREVLEATGFGLAYWQDQTPAPALDPAKAIRIAVTPEREWLYRRCDLRFDQMIQSGAIEEVERVMAMDLPQDAPGRRALGAAELMAWLRGEIDRETAVERAKMETRRYAKRQMTWIRNRMADWRHVEHADPATVPELLKS